VKRKQREKKMRTSRESSETEKGAEVTKGRRKACLKRQ
jgi:hypothetical protein